MLSKIRIKKVLNQSRVMAINRRWWPSIFNLRWSIQLYTSIVAWWLSSPAREDVLALTILQLYRDTHTMEVALNKEHQCEIGSLESACLLKYHLGSLFMPHFRYFVTGKGKDSSLLVELCLCTLGHGLSF